MFVAESPSQQRGRGRPRGGGAVERSEILESTLDAIAHGGYAGLSMRAVARSLGVSLAAVQYHFGTKAELYRAAIDYTLAGADQQRSLAAGRDLNQRIRNSLDVSSARPGVLAALLSDRSPGHEDRFAHFAQRFSELFDEPANELADIQSGGLGRPVDPQALMVLLTIGITSIAGAPEAVRAIYDIDLTRPDERNRLADALADIIGNGIFKTPTTTPPDTQGEPDPNGHG